MDAFFASVEQRDNPDLQGRPIVVGGEGDRGVVAAASYEARQYGVRSAMPSVIARRLCPALIFVRHRFEVYREVSSQIRDIFFSYTDLVEPLSLDEAYLDVTTPRQGPHSATLIAEEIREKIVNTTQLTASAGVSFNKFLAKVASDINKPNGIKVILPAEAMAFLEALPIRRFHGVGKVTADKMQRMGIHTGADIKARSELELIQYFGKAGRYFHRIVRGIDNRLVNPNRIRKSIGAERTYGEDISDVKIMKEKLSFLLDKVFDYMKKSNNFGRTLTIKMKTPDFQQYTRSRSFSSEIRTKSQLESCAFELLLENIQAVNTVRLLGVTVSNLEREQLSSGIQLVLDFPEEEE